MRFHIHTGPIRESLRAASSASWDDEGRGVVRAVRVVERRRTCTRCAATTTTTERDGRVIARRTTPPLTFVPVHPASYWGTE